MDNVNQKIILAKVSEQWIMSAKQQRKQQVLNMIIQAIMVAILVMQSASVQHDLVGPIDRPNVNQPAYKGGTYGFIALITFGSNLGNSSINSNTRNFSTNGSFINYFQGKKIEQWYQTNGSSGIAPYAPPSDNIRYQTLFYRVQYKDPWGSPWAYAIDFIPYPPIPAPIQGRGGNTLPVSFNLELSKPVTLEDFFSFPPRFPMELRPDRYGRISEDPVQGGVKVVARTALIVITQSQDLWR
ncbi:MAG: hypothetical protein IPP69_02905 [Flavobacteriales bacterium]|nr:hypothetical protein [Flavobacteriales bacterium]